MKTINGATLSVREIEEQDIEHITNYWLESPANYLQGMGVDIDKLPTATHLTRILNRQINTSIEQKVSFALIWLLDGEPIGHSNVDKIQFGQEAFMHLHIWKAEIRKKGLGVEWVKLSIPHFFQKLKLKKLLCEPYALNPAPHKTLQKVGFEAIKTYTTVPGSINFEQEVQRWELSKEKYLRSWK